MSVNKLDALQAGSWSHYHIVIAVLNYVHDQLWMPLFTQEEKNCAGVHVGKLHTEAVWNQAQKYGRQKIKAHECALDIMMIRLHLVLSVTLH
jgi:hypothetical protein